MFLKISLPDFPLCKRPTDRDYPDHFQQWLFLIGHSPCRNRPIQIIRNFPNKENRFTRLSSFQKACPSEGPRSQTRKKTFFQTDHFAMSFPVSCVTKCVWVNHQVSVIGGQIGRWWPGGGFEDTTITPITPLQHTLYVMWNTFRLLTYLSIAPIIPYQRSATSFV